MLRLRHHPYALVELRRGTDGDCHRAGVCWQSLGGYLGWQSRAHRRKGFGRQLMRAILQRLATACRSSLLAGELPNHGARALYEELGFTYCYTYWYRQK
ncbi:MAG UNVERIFIED_CONTAM: GNAT family N-acetyltransferase [Anaerolineae bacterium]|jgi:GNAT superfamily N-acetyltransferase